MSKSMSMREVVKASRKRCPHHGEYHLSSDGLAIVEPHPQATSCFAREQGYIVARVEPYYAELAPMIVDAMSRASKKSRTRASR